MKLFFLKDNSLYKIFKTLEKVPEGKSVHIYIDPEHTLFDNEWRWTQIKELLEKRNIKAFFVTKTERTKQFFVKLWLEVEHQETNKILKVLKLFYLFLFNIKKFHLYVYTKKNYIFYLVFSFEILFVLAIFYLLYTLILPSATIEITPAHQIENVIYNFRYYPYDDLEYPTTSRYITLPYYTGYIDYKYQMSISSSYLKHIQNPSHGEILLINTTDQEYSFLPNTRLVTDNGLLFQTKDWFKLPPQVDGVAGEAIIEVVAMEKDTEGILMGARWNITKDTKLYIKNLKNSFFLKEIYAQALEDFEWWSLQSEGLVTHKDIAVLSGKLQDYIQQQKKNIITQNFKIEEAILLPFNDLIKPNTKEIIIENQPGDKTAMLNGHIISRINFLYIKEEDLLNAVNIFVEQRPSEKIEVINIDKNTLTFFEWLKKSDNVYTIPTKIEVIQWYDFTNDINWIIESLKTHIIWQSKDKARKKALSYDEISTAHVKVSPPWYNSIPKLRSRIKIDIKKE